jgi:hypothetical protein
MKYSLLAAAVVVALGFASQATANPVPDAIYQGYAYANDGEGGGAIYIGRSVWT